MSLPATLVCYGAEADQVADIRLPVAEATGTLLIVIHGGDWQHAATREYLDGMVGALAGLGHAVASIEYRRLGGGGGWPMTFEDIAAALASVPAQARELARGAGLTLERTIVVGHSAGGQLALWAAAQPVSAEPPVTGVVALGATADLELGHELGVGEGAVAQLLGGAPAEVPEVIAQADPIRLVPRVPVRLLHVSDDPVVPVALSRAYAERVSGDVGYRELPGDSHFSFTTPAEMDWSELVTTIEELS